MAGIDGEVFDVAARATRPQSLIITIYGAYSRPLGGWISVSSLLELLRTVDIEDPAARSALSRLKRKDVLIAERREGTAGYAIGEATRKVFDLGDPRVLHRRNAPPDRGWILITFSIPEASRDLRYRLRSRLGRIGFGQVSGGLWIGPRQLEADAEHLIASLRLEANVDIFAGDYLGFQADRHAAAHWWDLDAIAAMHESFATEYASIARRATTLAKDPQQAFAAYTRALTAWRPIPYADPGLPTAYLPRSWPGVKSSNVFFALHDALATPAMRYVRDVTRS